MKRDLHSRRRYGPGSDRGLHRPVDEAIALLCPVTLLGTPVPIHP